MLEIEVHEIKGSCPIFEKGDRIVIDGPEINLEKTDALCTHALETILHYSTALENGVNPVNVGLSKTDENTAFMQCVDPGKQYTGGGTVIFRCDIH